MALYRFFILNSGGHVVDGASQEFTDDMEALDQVRKLAANRGIQLWRDGRQIASVNVDDGAVAETKAA